MKVQNKELVQSYIVTTAKYDFSVQEKRILYKVIESFQGELEGQKLSTSFQLKTNGDMQITMPTRAFLKSDEDKNHNLVKNALKSLRNKTFDFDDKESGVLSVVGIIERPSYSYRGEFVTFELDKRVHEALFDFVKGHRAYELKTAFELESIYAMRFYELFSKQQRPIDYTIETLKSMFNIEDKYVGRTSDFVKYVVKAAKEELDKKSPYSFDYEVIKLGRKIHKIRFRPKYLPKNDDHELQKKKLMKRSSTAWVIDSGVKASLKEHGFSEKEIKNNITLFEEASKKFKNSWDFHGFVISRLGKSRTKKPNEKGWFINALKGKVVDLDI